MVNRWSQSTGGSLHWTRTVLGCLQAGIPSQYVTNQPVRSTQPGHPSAERLNENSADRLNENQQKAIKKTMFPLVRAVLMRSVIQICAAIDLCAVNSTG